MRVAVLYNAVRDQADPDERDVLVQLEAVSQALRRLAHEPTPVACTLDLMALRHHLERRRPEIAFNLVESLGGHGRLIHVIPALLEALGLPYTGSSAEALFLTSHKTLAKERLRALGLPTPGWIGPWPSAGRLLLERGDGSPPRDGRYVIKSLWEHASLGLADDLVVEGGNPERVRRSMQEWAPRLGGSCFAEAYVEGRELNLSLLAGPEGPEVLPPAEIDFSAFPEGKPRIVGYRAKWAEGSFEYRHTPRRFDFPDTDRELLGQLKGSAQACWAIFGLRGYARVDFRVDTQGQPWVLEVNANPCLSPDAGFAAAVGQAGLTFDDTIQRILEDAPSGRTGEPLGA